MWGVVAMLGLAAVCNAAAPVAPHLTAVVGVNGEVVISLTGYDSDGDALLARVSRVPSEGSLHQLSQVFSRHGYDPKSGSEISSNLTLVSGSGNRVVYVAPRNRNSPAGAWTTFTYTVHDGTSQSEEGIVWVLPPHGRMVWSDFSVGTDGWSVSGNGRTAQQLQHGGLVWEPFSRGLLNRYVLATDDEVRAGGQESDGDLTRFAFEAPSKFLGNHAAAFNGHFHFTLGSSSGDFSATNLNPDARVVVLECGSCDSGRGILLVRFLHQGAVPTDGTEAKVAIPLKPSAWRIDPKSSIQQWTAPTQCQLVEALSGITRLAIVGDLTRWYESIAIDDVGFTRGNGVPIQCAPIYY